MRLERLREDPGGLAGIELKGCSVEDVAGIRLAEPVVVLGWENMNCPVMSSRARGVAVMIPCI